MKINIIQEALSLDKPKEVAKSVVIEPVVAKEKEMKSVGVGNELDLKEMKSVCVGNEIDLKEMSTQTDSIDPINIEQMEMIISNAEETEEQFVVVPILAPPTLFEDESSRQFNVRQNHDLDSRKPKIISNERVKILNKSTSDLFSTPKQFKKKAIAKIDNFPDNKPKILNSQLKMPQFDSTIIESIEEAPDGSIEIITYDNEEYLDEDQVNQKKYQVQTMDKSEDGVVYTCDVCDRGFPLLQQLELHKQNHERERNFPCKLCEKAFFTKYDLAKHLLTHTKQKGKTLN